MQKGFWFLVCILAICILSCTKATGPANANSAQPNNKLDTLVSMSANVNRHLFATKSVYGYNIKSPVPGNSVKTLMVTASETSRDSTVTITFYLSGYYGPGIYIVSPPAITAEWFLGNTRHFATSGQITVTSDTAYAIVGNFNFIADSIIVSDGIFNVLKPF